MSLMYLKDKINNLTLQKQNILNKLDLYYCLDDDDDVDHSCILDNIDFKLYTKDYHINKCVEYTANKQSNYNRGEDIIHTGISILNEMFDELKLKGSNEVWFLYIGNGKFKTNSCTSNVCLALLNKNPSIKSCLYAVYNSTKETHQKMNNMSIVLNRLFSNKDKMIKYN